MKLLQSLLVLSVLSFQPLSAQSPVLLPEDMLAVGPIDDLTKLFVQVFLGADVFATVGDAVSAEEQQWELTGLENVPATTEISKTLVTCNGVPQAELFEDCTSVYHLSVGSIADSYEFTSFSAPDLYSLGTHSTDPGGTQTTICDEDKLIYRFPVEFGSNISTNYSCSPDELGVGFQEEEFGTRTSTCNGWGTVILPDATLTECLRMQHIEVATRNTYFDGTLFQVSNVTRTTIEYLKANYPFPIATFTKTDIDKNPSFYEGEYMIKGFLNSTQGYGQVITGMSVYPNPATSGRVILDVGHSEYRDIQYNLYTLDGKSLYSQDQRIGAAIGQTEVRLPDVAPGMYVFTVRSGGLTQNFKLGID